MRILFYLLLLSQLCYIPLCYSKTTIQLTLNEAILLGVRNNPNVLNTQLAYVLQKFNLYVANWQFYPHYAFQATYSQSRAKTNGSAFNSSRNMNASPQINLLTPIGTQITVTGNNTKTDSYNPGISLSIVQPLLQGFGPAIVEAELNNARDSEVIARLNIEEVLRTTITNIINAYLDVISAEKTIDNDMYALKRAEQAVQQTKLFIKAGRKAGNELVTVEANVATARSQLENDKNNLLQTRYALLTAIGLDPNTNVKVTSVTLDNLFAKYRFPPVNQISQLALANDISYQTSVITLNGSTQRALAIARDNTRWGLSVSLNATTGNGAGNGHNSGFNSVFNGANQSQGVALNLTIPLDNQNLKQALLSAKIALQQAKLSLQQLKWSKETAAITSWNSVKSVERAKQFSEEAEALQEKTYQISYQKYLHGLIDSLELQSAQIQLTQAQQSMLAARITYLKALVNLDYLIGHTLSTWQVKVRLK